MKLNFIHLQHRDAGITAGLIAAGTALASQGANAYATGKLNKKNRQWQEGRYIQQRIHNLEDWNMQNEYNSPQAQMQRLKAAGLNPNLVYDNGASAISSQAVKSADTGSWNPEAPKVDLGGAAQAGLSAYYDAQLKPAQVDNMKVQNELLQADKELKAAQIANTQAQTVSTLANVDTTKFDLSQKQRLADTQFEAMRAALNKTLVDTATTVDANTRANMLHPGNLQNQIEDILNKKQLNAKSKSEQDLIAAQIKNLGADKDLKELQYKQTKDNISNNDPWYVKMLTKILKHYGLDIDSLPPAPKGTRPGTAAEYWKKAYPNSPLNHLFK